MDITLLLISFASGAIAWHFFHAKAHAALAALEARVSLLEGKPAAPPASPPT